MDRTPTPSRAQERVRAALAAQGFTDVQVREFAESTATAVDAAAAIGTSVERIVKSLVFAASNRPVLVLASGPNRVDMHKLGKLLGEPVSRANANQVREWTGYAVGGVPPLGHPVAIDTYLDQDLLQYDCVWAALGTPNAVFAIAPDDLQRITSAQVAEVAQAQ
jgi:Cys-tRNA(Pro) deacylase